ncbi:hypothetical protein ACFXTN_035096 [Malus domestica]
MKEVILPLSDLSCSPGRILPVRCPSSGKLIFECKSRGSQIGLLGASPRNRRSRRRSENETREEKVSGLVEEVVKPIKRRSKKEKLDLVLSLPSPSSLNR